MKTKGLWKNYIIVLVLAACFLVFGLGAQASSGTGSISLHLPKEAEGAEFTVIKVADMGNDGTFAYTSAFAGSTVSLMDMGNAQDAAEQFWLQAQTAGVAGTAYRATANGLIISDLMPGYYLVVQTSGQNGAEVQKVLAPIPYLQEDGIGNPVYDVDLTPKFEIPVGAAILTKDDGSGVPVAGAHFDLERKVYIAQEGAAPENMETGMDAGGRFTWEKYRSDLITNDVGQIAMEKLPLGMYRLMETTAPTGYFLNTAPAYFEIKAEGTVQLNGGQYTALSGSVEQVYVANTPTKLLVNKVDEDGNALEGAYFVIENPDGSDIVDEDGHPKYWFVSSAEPYELKGLPPGNYLLCELFSPQGFVVGADVPFTISPDPNVVNTVTMVDEPEEETSESLRVTKHLYDVDGNNLTAVEDTFYVALFSDEARTTRISDVKALRFAGESSTSVVYENLQPGGTYYVGETDEFGNLLESGQSGDAIFLPEYPNGYEVVLGQNTEDEFAFANMFYEVPGNYYISGELTVTKKTLLNGADYPRKGKFYAAIFEDAELTKRVGDVIELPMGGNSTASVTRTDLFIGTTVPSSITYYVAETDKNGVPLKQAEVTAYIISMDKDQVTLTTDQSTEQVTITNDFTEEQTEVETEIPSEETSSSNSDTPGSNTPGGGSNAPQTGDDTPIGLYVTLLVVALAAIVIVAVGRKKKQGSK